MLILSKFHLRNLAIRRRFYTIRQRLYLLIKDFLYICILILATENNS